jgi:NRAMP (natural resistance-associated macrophage protein)-like metal ion transporter
MNILSKLYYKFRRAVKFLRLFLLIAGPGIIVMVADNDAGGITTYSATGARYGYGLLWFLILLGPLAFVVQEMTVRLGAVTKRGHAESIFDAFGPFWGWFSLADLVLTDWLTLVTEFIGMTAALSIFGVPRLFTVLAVCAIMAFMVLQGRYWTWEKIAMLFCALNLIYIPAAFLVHPDWSQVLHGSVIPSLPGGVSSDLFFFLMANIGTTIAPWMIFFQQSSVVDKGLQEKDIPWEKLDTAVGAVFTIFIALFCVILTGTLLRGSTVGSADEAARMLMGVNHTLGSLLAIGLFNAGFLGAICISLATSWAFGEVFGWAHSLNQNVREAPWFYAFYFLMILTAGGVVLIPGAPLVLITLFVQVVATTLLSASLVFLLLLLNEESIMGRFRNTLWQNVIGTTIVVSIIVLSTLYSISVVFPHLFG